MMTFTEDNNHIKNATLLSVSKLKTAEFVKDKPDHAINVFIIFTNVVYYSHLQKKFATTVASLLKFSSIPINLYLLGDLESYRIAKDILKGAADGHKYRVMHLDINSLTISEMKKYFSKPDTYFSDSLFFVTVIIHKVLPDKHRVIMLDLKFNADIKELFERFNLFHNTNIIGISREAQPAYRHVFQMFINKSKGTRVGDPPPDGLTGFNSGVLLLDLDRLRKSEVYSSALNADFMKKMTEKYTFQENFGDQDFFTLLSLEHEDLFHILPCTWNRQLCTSWRNRGYDEVFDQYFSCDGYINIYHGNCNTSIPRLKWET